MDTSPPHCEHFSFKTMVDSPGLASNIFFIMFIIGLSSALSSFLYPLPTRHQVVESVFSVHVFIDDALFRFLRDFFFILSGSSP